MFNRKNRRLRKSRRDNALMLLSGSRTTTSVVTRTLVCLSFAVSASSGLGFFLGIVVPRQQHRQRGGGGALAAATSGWTSCGGGSSNSAFRRDRPVLPGTERGARRQGLSSTMLSNPTTSTSQDASETMAVHLNEADVVDRQAAEEQRIGCGGGIVTNSTTEAARDADDAEEESSPSSTSHDKTSGTKPTSPHVRIKVHSYTDPSTRREYQALNTPVQKFLSFLLYNNLTRACTDDIVTDTITVSSLPEREREGGDGTDKAVVSEGDDAYDDATFEKVRASWRELWTQGRLITDRTELLSPHYNGGSQRGAGGATGFSHLLRLYTDRMVSMLSDERLDNETLLKYLQLNYGFHQTLELEASTLHKLSGEQQLQSLQQFLHWFRDQFPYYYDRCSHCGASVREESMNINAHDDEDDGEAELIPEEGEDNDTKSGTVTTAPVHLIRDADLTPEARLAGTADDGIVDQEQEDEEEDEEDVHDDDDDEDEHQSFLGYIYPSDRELLGKASRTELYRCHECDMFTRFPRYNSAAHVLETKKGRCGEYSMLLYRFLRVLKHDVRWVVDWADHVWVRCAVSQDRFTLTAFTLILPCLFLLFPMQVEIRLQNRWIHLDPCEAAVDEFLTYQGWGKKQTYILGFYAPLELGVAREGSIETTASTSTQSLPTRIARNGEHPNALSASNKNGKSAPALSTAFPLIEDVTESYTTDTWEEIWKRRRGDEEEDNSKNSSGSSSSSSSNENANDDDGTADRDEQKLRRQHETEVRACIEAASVELRDKLLSARCDTGSGAPAQAPQ